MSLFLCGKKEGSVPDSEIETLEMSLSGTQYNPTRHFLNSIKMN